MGVQKNVVQCSLYYLIVIESYSTINIINLFNYELLINVY